MAVQIKENLTFATIKSTNLLLNPMSVHHIGFPLTILQTVDSSNNYAMAKAHARATSHGEAFFALEQTAGKGQMGKQWLSRKGENIILSIVLETARLSPDAGFLLSMCLAMGCHDWLSGYTGDETSIKWPNDLYWRDRKAGGILIENVWTGSVWQFAIAGFGINVNQSKFEEAARRPVSIKQITGKDTDLLKAVTDLCNYLEQRWQQLLTDSKEQILEEYNARLYSKGKTVKLRYKEEILETIILGVNLSGELMTGGDSQRNFRVGEVEWI
jgi:BirA family biotin operon repressor/biotin-[acetyl-CoA-carboxylase] ligase